MFTIKHSVAEIAVEPSVEFLDLYEPLFDAAMKCRIEARQEGKGIEIEVDFDSGTIVSFFVNENFKEFFLQNEREVIKAVLIEKVWTHLNPRRLTRAEHLGMLEYGWPEQWVKENEKLLEQYFD